MGLLILSFLFASVLAALPPCDPLLRFCTEDGQFDSIYKYRIFEGSIPLYQFGYMAYLNESRP